MKTHLTIGLGALLCWTLAAHQMASAQTATEEVPQPSIVLVKLSPPKYPPLARQARITGDVTVDLDIRPDGSIASVQPFSGHPMLAPAAVQSAQGSTFECRQCNGMTRYRLTFTFDVYDDGVCSVPEAIPARSPRCLYLWKCGVEYVYIRRKPTSPPPELVETPGHVTIRASEVCVETESASLSK